MRHILVVADSATGDNQTERAHLVKQQVDQLFPDERRVLSSVFYEIDDSRARGNSFYCAASNLAHDLGILFGETSQSQDFHNLDQLIRFTQLELFEEFLHAERIHNAFYCFEPESNILREFLKRRYDMHATFGWRKPRKLYPDVESVIIFDISERREHWLQPELQTTP